MIKKVFLDIFLIYKNFIHFTLSKILIFLTTFALSIIFILPILLIIWLILHFIWAIDYVNFNINLFSILWNIYYLIVLSFLSILWFLILTTTYSYNFVLFTRLFFSYIDWEKLSFKKNSYFDFSLFFVYVKTFLLVLFIILVPVFVFLILLLILFFSFWWTEAITSDMNSGNNAFPIISLIILLISLLMSGYLSYKTILSLTILVDEYDNEEEPRKAIHYIKKSFKLTKWFKKAWYFSIVSLLVMLMTLPIYIPQGIYEAKARDLSDYLDYKAWLIELTQDNVYLLQRLELNFWKTDISTLQDDLSFASNMTNLFYFLEFLFITWLMSMTISSLYFRLFKKD